MISLLLGIHSNSRDWITTVDILEQRQYGVYYSNRLKKMQKNF